jgi:hypothetical protein
MDGVKSERDGWFPALSQLIWKRQEKIQKIAESGL